MLSRIKWICIAVFGVAAWCAFFGSYFSAMQDHFRETDKPKSEAEVRRESAAHDVERMAQSPTHDTTPEPASLALFGVAATGLLFRRRARA